jgi:hypothetical protein
LVSRMATLMAKVSSYGALSTASIPV